MILSLKVGGLAVGSGMGSIDCSGYGFIINGVLGGRVWLKREESLANLDFI